MNYELINSLGLEVKPLEVYGYDCAEMKYVVDAEKLEKILGAGRTYYYAGNSTSNLMCKREPHHTHRQIQINTPIENSKPVTAEEIKLALNILSRIVSGPTAATKKVLERILKDGVEG